MARTRHTKEKIRCYISESFGYDLDRNFDDIRPTYGFDGRGAIAAAYYNKMPYTLYEFGTKKLPEDILLVIRNFNGKYEAKVSRAWRNAELDVEELVRKVKSGKIFI